MPPVRPFALFNLFQIFQFTFQLLFSGYVHFSAVTFSSDSFHKPNHSSPFSWVPYQFFRRAVLAAITVLALLGTLNHLPALPYVQRHVFTTHHSGNTHTFPMSRGCRIPVNQRVRTSLYTPYLFRHTFKESNPFPALSWVPLSFFDAFYTDKISFATFCTYPGRMRPMFRINSE